METAVVAVVIVLLVITVAIACVLCYFSCDSRAQEPHADPGHGFTVVTFQQKASLFTGPSRPTQPRTTARDFWTFMLAPVLGLERKLVDGARGELSAGCRMEPEK